MTDIVNLNKFRKSKQKDAAKRTAAANRAKFGRAKADKDRDAAERERQTKIVDDAKHKDDDC